MKKIFLSAAAVLGLAGAAMAGDNQAVLPAAPGAGWSGAYAGLHYAEGEGKTDVAPFAGDYAASGLGLHVGYLSERGAIVTGGELSVTSVEADLSDENADFIEGKLITGYDAGRVLPYATVGLSHGSIRNVSRTAPLYGLGAKFQATDRLMLGVEWTRAGFKDVGGVEGWDADKDSVSGNVSFRF